MRRRMSVCWPPCAGVWCLHGSGKMTPTRCSTAPATAAVRICCQRRHTRCVPFFHHCFVHNAAAPSVLTFCDLPEGPDDEGTALRHLSWWFLWVEEGGQRQAAFLHILSSMSDSQWRVNQDSGRLWLWRKDRGLCWFFYGILAAASDLYS